jgi:ferric-dicitrate binding protein FerR (iron transport regulator)
MDSNTEDEKNIVDHICTEALYVINALKYPDLSQQMADRKPYIFEQVDHKINADKRERSSKGKRQNMPPRYLAAACALVFLAALSAISYYMGYAAEKKLPEQAQVDVRVPYGVLSRIELPDGSLVVLNGGSRLSYPASFGKKRELFLSGEGFFEIVKDEKHPCVVNTKNLSAKVLGTRFSFKAYEEDEQTVLTLEEGSLSAVSTGKDKNECIFLKPDQQLILNHHTGDLRRKTVRAYNYTSWKDGHLSFINMSLGEIATALERRFDLKITFEAESLREESYYAQFENDENPERILDLLSQKRAWTYARKNNVIAIVEKK